MNKEYILTEIRRTAAANGGMPLGRSRFSREIGIVEADWIGKIWARWATPFERPASKPTNWRRLTMKTC
jgi:hypothetical protein